MAANGSETLEVRLALVCYGGVSLAIYMSGITREIQELVTGSARFASSGRGRPPGTAAVYARLIEALETDAAAHGDPHRIQVGVDIVAGTSAGGINGICLARALDGDYSQEAIRDFWIDGGRTSGRSSTPKVGAAPGQGAGGVERSPRDRAATRQAPRPRSGAPVLVRPVGGRGSGLHRVRRGPPAQDAGDDVREAPPARARSTGDLMCSLTWGALNGHAEAHASCSGAVPLRRERDRPGGHGDRVRRALRRRPALARARLRRGPPARLPHPRGRAEARSTPTSGCSRSPPARRRRSRARSRRSASTTSEQQLERRRRRGGLGAIIARATWRGTRATARRGDRRFVDGGVLDNMPFDAAIAAIRGRTVAGRGAPRARVRRAVTDGRRRDAEPLELPDLDVPESNVVSETFRSVSTIPLSQTMGDQIARVRRRNDRVLALRSVIEQRFDAVAERVDDIAREAAAGGPNPLADAGADPPAGWWQAVSGAAHASPDLTPTYGRIKIGHVVDRFAETIADVCGYADGLPRELVGEVMRRAAVAAGLLPDVGGTTPSVLGRSPSAQIEFLRAFDVEYERRRIGFVRDGVAWLYGAGEAGGPDRAQIDAVKHVLFERASDLEHAWDTLVADDDLRARAHGTFGGAALQGLLPPAEFDPDWDLETKLSEFVAANASDLEALETLARAALEKAMGSFGGTTFTRLLAALADWREGRRAELRADLLRRYIGFPIWDAITYPLTVERRGRRARRPDRALPRQPARDADRAASRPHEAQARGHGHASFRRVLRPPGP